MVTFRALSLGLLTCFLWVKPSLAQQTLYSNLPIPQTCKTDYQQGRMFLAQLLKEGFDLGNRNVTVSTLDKELSRYSEDDECRFYFSVGMFDTQGLVQQQTTLEYFLELQIAEAQNNPNQLKGIETLYQERFKKLGLTASLTETLKNNIALRTQSLEKLTTQLNSLAEEKNEAIFLGRFVFLGSPFGVMTLYDYVFEADGTIKKGANAQELITEGSYPKTAKATFERATDVAKQYLDWHPSLFFGEDSLWRGAWWRYFGSTYEKSLREVKNEGYLNLFLQHISLARKLRVDTQDYRKIYQLMLNKDRSTLNREIGTYDKMYRYRWAPLLVPVGMYAGSAMLVKSTWFLALPANASSFSFVGGGLATAANASAAVSLLTISTYSGLGLRAAYLDYRDRKSQGLPFSMAETLDHVFSATYQSFALAAITPVIVGSSVYSAHEALVAAKSLLSSAISAGETIQTLGFQGSVEAAKSYLFQVPGKLVALPQFVAQKWLESWYKNPKILISNYGADILMTLLFDCGYRQVNLEGKDVCVWRDEQGTHLNSQFLYSITSTVIVGGISKPVTLIPSFGLRWVTYRGVTLLSGVVSQLLVSGKLDSRRLVFDQFYGAGPSTIKGEFERYIRMSDWVQSKTMAQQTILIIALRALVLSPIESPIKIYFLDRFVKGQLKPIQELKELMKDVAYLSIDDFADSDIEEAIRAVGQEIGR